MSKIIGVDKNKPAVPARPGLLARNVLWLTSGELLSRLIAAVVAIYLARKLGAESFGAIGVALAVVSYLIVAVDGGMDPYGIREVARNPEQLPYIFRQIIGARLLLGLMMYLVLVLLVVSLPERAIGGKDLALIFGGRLLTYALKLDWALRGREEMKVVSIGVVAQHLIYAAGIFFLVRGPRPALIIVPIVHVTAEVVLTLFYYLWLRHKCAALWGSIGPVRRGPFVRESLPVWLGKGLRLAYYEGDMVLLGLLSAPEQAGYFLVSHKLVLSLVALVVLYQQNAFPALSRLVLKDPSEGANFQRAVSRYALLWSVPVAAGGIYLGAPLIEILFGIEYRGSGAIFSTMLFTVPLMLTGTGLHHQLLASGHSKLYLYSVLPGTLLHIVLGVLWVPTGGGLGAARASLLGESVIVLLAAYCLWDKQGIAPLCRRSSSVVLAGCLMIMAMFLFRHIHLALLGILGSAAYMISVVSLGGVRRHEIRQFLEIWRRSDP